MFIFSFLPLWNLIKDLTHYQLINSQLIRKFLKLKENFS